MASWHQPRGDHDPFSGHEPVGREPADPDPSGVGGTALPDGPASVPEATASGDVDHPGALVEAPVVPTQAEADAPVVKRRRTTRKRTQRRADPELDAELAALERPE